MNNDNDGAKFVPNRFELTCCVVPSLFLIAAAAAGLVRLSNPLQLITGCSVKFMFRTSKLEDCESQICRRKIMVCLGKCGLQE